MYVLNLFCLLNLKNYFVKIDRKYKWWLKIGKIMWYLIIKYGYFV